MKHLVAKDVESIVNKRFTKAVITHLKSLFDNAIEISFGNGILCFKNNSYDFSLEFYRLNEEGINRYKARGWNPKDVPLINDNENFKKNRVYFYDSKLREIYYMGD